MNGAGHTRADVMCRDPTNMQKEKRLLTPTNPLIYAQTNYFDFHIATNKCKYIQKRGCT